MIAFSKRLTLLLMAVIFFTGCSSTTVHKENQVCFKQQCFKVEIVQSVEERRRGLQFRENLGEDKGMLFMMPHSGRHGFWMKDTLIPLDIIWLDYARKIVHIAADTPPCQKMPCPSYKPATDALYVLEINAGRAKKIGLKRGGEARFFIKGDK